MEVYYHNVRYDIYDNMTDFPSIMVGVSTVLRENIQIYLILAVLNILEVNTADV